MKNTDKEDKIKPNFAKMVKSIEYDYRIVKATYEKAENGKNNETNRPPRPVQAGFIQVSHPGKA